MHLNDRGNLFEPNGYKHIDYLLSEGRIVSLHRVGKTAPVSKQAPASKPAPISKQALVKAGMQICKNSELLWHARPLQTLKSVILACLATPNAARDYGDTVVQVAEI